MVSIASQLCFTLKPLRQLLIKIELPFACNPLGQTCYYTAPYGLSNAIMKSVNALSKNIKEMQQTLQCSKWLKIIMTVFGWLHFYLDSIILQWCCSLVLWNPLILNTIIVVTIMRIEMTNKHCHTHPEPHQFINPVTLAFKLPDDITI